MRAEREERGERKERAERIELSREWLHYDIAGMAYVVADIKEGVRDAHTLHQTFDICSGDNALRTDRILDLSFAEVAAMLRRVARGESDAGGYRLCFRRGTVDKAAATLLREAVREYLVARVLADRLAVTLPEAAPPWEAKAARALETIGHEARGAITTRGRRVSPI